MDALHVLAVGTGRTVQPPPRPTTPTAGRRRPSGEPPPLPRPVSPTTRLAGALLALAGTLSIALVTPTGRRVVTGSDLLVLRALERVRVSRLTELAELIADVASPVTFGVVAWAVLLVLLAARRFQHLFATLTLFLTVPVFVAVLIDLVGRMRPVEIEIVAGWDGYAHPSLPVVAMALVLTTAMLVLAPRGRWRTWAVCVVATVLSVVVAARLYTGVDHPTDAAVALVLGVGCSVLALRLLTPEEAFPVTYRRGVRAHLDVGGRRGEAIRQALANQLAVQAIDVEPFELSGSAGSTPLRITTTDGELFGKLYARVHMRSDRWYKLSRTVLYGRLEDEHPFNSVRRLVEYEDHMLRVFRDAGVPTARPHGILEITPEREYLLVTDLIPRARHVTDSEVTAEVVDDALSIVRHLWDAGLAHRDIKPSNLLVADGRVWLIDVAFAEVRPSPWRQAVDLANVMLTLALCVPPELVYQRATRLFTPDEVAEAFAASRAVTIPSQLRSLLHDRDDDPAAAFRALAPPRRPVAIQRWSVRRAALTAAVLGAIIAGLALVAANVRLVGEAAPPVQRTPACEPGARLALVAQSVTDAAYVPCVAELPAGWSFEGLDVDDTGATMSLDSDRADRDVEVTLAPSCDLGGAVPVAPSDVGVRSYHRVASISPRYSGQLLDAFPGGCVVATYDFVRGPHVALITELQDAIGLFPRRDLRQWVKSDLGVSLDP